MPRGDDDDGDDDVRRNHPVLFFEDVWCAAWFCVQNSGAGIAVAFLLSTRTLHRLSLVRRTICGHSNSDIRRSK